ncbi:hydroxycarboxylic acid receptor 2-like [Aplochiton taeniatus]
MDTTKQCCEFVGALLIRILPPVLLAEFIFGVLGNGLALWIFCFHLKPWKSSTVFLFNLALADFLLNVGLPFRASYYISGMDWRFGDTFCKVSLFLLAMNRSGSILFLTAVAVDRYIRVVHPHHPLNSISVSKAVWGAVGLWGATISMTAHLLTELTPRQNNTRCDSFAICTVPGDSLIWHKWMFVFSFYLPLAVILFCTMCTISKLKGRQLSQHARIRKALRIISIVVVLFVVCFLPSNITQLLIWYKKTSLCKELEDLNTAFYLTISMTYLNSVLDPVVYYFSIPTFKNMFRRAIRLGEVEETGDSRENKSREPGNHSVSQL